MTNPSVIIATEQEQTVRVYVGTPSNGGMNQVAQIATTHAIDPHDLADMAVSLSVQFGWLENGTREIDAAPAKAVGPTPIALVQGKESSHQPSVDPALGSYRTPRMAQLVGCPVKGCKHRARRKNLSQHLQTKLAGHAWAKDEANRAARVAKPIEGVPVPPPDPVSSDASKRAAQKSKANSVTRRQQRGKAVRVGAAGAKTLRDVIFPKLLAWVAEQGEVTSGDVAKHFDESTSTTGTWLRKLGNEGQLVCINPDSPAGVQLRWRLPMRTPQAPPPPLAQPLTTGVGFGHEHEAHTPNPNQESESTYV